MSTIWESPGGTRRDGVPPVSADDEAKIVICIVQELSEKFSLELSLSPALSRTEGEQTKHCLLLSGKVMEDEWVKRS